MKKSIKKLFAVSLLAMIFVSNSFADIIYPDGTKPTPEPYALRKVSRGIANILTFPFEIPKAIFDVGRDEGIFSSQQITYGLLNLGPYKAALRLGEGVYDIATFNEHNKTWLRLEPEYLDIGDIIPGYHDQFQWETTYTPAHRY